MCRSKTRSLERQARSIVEGTTPYDGHYHFPLPRSGSELGKEGSQAREMVIKTNKTEEGLTTYDFLLF